MQARAAVEAGAVEYKKIRPLKRNNPLTPLPSYALLTIQALAAARPLRTDGSLASHSIRNHPVQQLHDLTILALYLGHITPKLVDGALQPHELLLARSSQLSGWTVRSTIGLGRAPPPARVASAVPSMAQLLLRRHLLLVHLHAKPGSCELIVAESCRSLRFELALAPGLLSKRALMLLCSRGGERELMATTLEGRVCPWRCPTLAKCRLRRS